MELTMEASTPRSKNAKDIASGLLRIGAVKFNMDSPFTWVSGIRSPIYCDNRLINSHVDVRKIVVKAFIDEIDRLYPDVEVIAGVATGGISFASLIANEKDMPMVYVREKPKAHGLLKQIEGFAEAGSRIVLIEDHISTGGSSIKAAQAIRREGFELLGLVSILQYGFDLARERFLENNLQFTSLCEFEVIIDVAVEQGILKPSDRTSILSFKKDPSNWINTRP